jgi:hypothetical protein
LTHLALPEATQAISPTDSDNFFTSHLLKTVKLTYLDISGAKATSLTFLNHLGNLETLILDTCELIQDKDLFPLKTVPKLTHLYLCFMNVTPRGIIKAIHVVRILISYVLCLRVF